MAIGIVQESGVVRINANKNSPHAKMNVKRNVAKNPFLVSGNTNFRKIVNHEYPSSRAASSISFGTSSKKLFIIHIAKGSPELMYKRINPWGVPLNPIYEYNTNIGSAITIPGIKRWERMKNNRSSFPKKLNLEKPYAASEPRNIAIKVEEVTKKRLFRIAIGPSARVVFEENISR
jgi:hypothetical protein